MSRTIKELLQILHDDVEKSGVEEHGLCYKVKTLYFTTSAITLGEYWELASYINNNRPKWYSNLAAFRASGTDYFWPKGKVAPRLKWLKKHIKLNS